MIIRRTFFISRTNKVRRYTNIIYPKTRYDIIIIIILLCDNSSRLESRLEQKNSKEGSSLLQSIPSWSAVYCYITQYTLQKDRHADGQTSVDLFVHIG